MVVPSPNFPSALAPQQNSRESLALIPHACAPPPPVCSPMLTDDHLVVLHQEFVSPSVGTSPPFPERQSFPQLTSPLKSMDLGAETFGVPLRESQLVPTQILSLLSALSKINVPGTLSVRAPFPMYPAVSPPPGSIRIKASFAPMDTGRVQLANASSDKNETATKSQ